MLSAVKRMRTKSATIAAALSVALLGAAVLTACQGQVPSSESSASTILTMELPPEVSAKGVVLAAVLLSTSDIEAALAEGLVTPTELEYAQSAIDDGTLAEWKQRAEKELSGK